MPKNEFWKAFFEIVIQIGAIFAPFALLSRRQSSICWSAQRAATHSPRTMSRMEVGKRRRGPDRQAPDDNGTRCFASHMSTVHRSSVKKGLLSVVISNGARYEVIIIATVPVLAAGLAGEEHLQGSRCRSRSARRLQHGGVIMLVIERLPLPRYEAERMENISFTQAIIIGLCQILGGDLRAPPIGRDECPVGAGLRRLPPGGDEGLRLLPGHSRHVRRVADTRC